MRGEGGGDGQQPGREAPLDILYAGTLPPHTGGSAMVGGDLLRGLAERGHRVRAVAEITEALARDPDGFALAHPRIPVRRIVLPYFDDSPDRVRSEDYRRREGGQVAAALQALIRERRPDVLIAGRESFAPYVRPVAAAHRLPSVLLVQGATTFGIQRGTIAAPAARALRERYRRFDLVVSVARHLLPVLRGWGLERVMAIENAVDTGRFHPAPKDPRLLRELAIGPEQIVVAHVSNLKPLKRAQDLVASADAALRQDPRLTYVVVGDGAQRRELEAACRGAGIEARFRFVGWVPRERVADYLNLADIVAMPSAAEARALVYLETQACGRVLLASDIAAAREVVTDGATGLLFPTGDVAALTAKTLVAARDPRLRACIGDAARAAALGRPMREMVTAYESALGTLVRDRAATHLL